jgi:isopenicillin-N epimerase
MPNWPEARAQMLLDPEVANLNTGSFGPLAREVFAEATRFRQRLAEEPMDFLVRQVPPLLWTARQRLATFMGGDPHRLVFTANVTASVNMVASSLRLAAPGEILLTDHEYGAMHWCWQRAAQRQRLTLRTFPLPLMPRSPDEIVDAACAAFTPRTRLLFFSHVLSPTGLVLPARELCAEARRHGIQTMIDGAHAPAMIPLNLEELACDYYGANCHKWLLAPTGSGFLYFGHGCAEQVQPLQVSWGWYPNRARWDEADEFGSTARLRTFEFEGTRDPTPWLAVPAAIDFQEGLGLQPIRARNEELAAYVCTRLDGLACLRLATPPEKALHGFMTAFRLPGNVEGGRLRARLWDRHRIEAPIIERPEGLLIRVSTHFYNTHAEIDRLAAALPECLAFSSKD